MVENVPEEQQDEDNGRLSQNIVDEDNAMLSYEMEDTDIPHQICANCCRQQYTFNEDNPHFLVFVTCELKDIRKVRKFRFVSKEGDPHSDVILCQQCHVFLTNEDRKEANFFKYTWPAFMWCLIENNANRNIYGTKLWKFFPSDWRKWWYSSARLLFDTPISIDKPDAIVKDRTTDILDFYRKKSSGKLGKIAEAYDDYCIMDVLCPWGCNEYIFESGIFQFDIFIQRFCPRVKILLSSKADLLDKIISCRDDCVRDTFEDYDILDFNPDWRCLPSLCFKPEGAPYIMTCREHDGGTKKLYIHPPRQPYLNLPAPYPDQVCHAVVRPRTIKNMHAKAFSNSYQMYEQRGNFQGIDTCDITKFGDFGLHSFLLQTYENLSIANRPDLASLLKDLAREGNISPILAESKILAANKYGYPKKDVDKCLLGSTFITIEDAMCLQQYLSEDQAIKIVKDDSPDCPITEVTCIPNWVKRIIFCQKIDPEKYGSRFPKLLQFQVTEIDTRLVWILSACLLRIPELWNATTKIQMRTSNWHGWLLSYLSSHCFPHVSSFSSRYSPFKKNQIKTITDLCKKIKINGNVNINGQYEYNPRHLVDIFVHHENVLVTGMIEDFDLEINEHHDIILLYNDIETDDELSPDFFLNNQYIISGNNTFELRFLSTTATTLHHWGGTVYCRHGGKNFTSYWKKNKKDAHDLQCNEGNSIPFAQTHFDVVGYVKVVALEMNKHRSTFLKYIGAQNHVLCGKHTIPLITSTRNNNRCCEMIDSEDGQILCNRNTNMYCPFPSCTTVLCNNCFKKRSDMSLHLIHSIENDTNDDLVSIESTETNDSDDSSSYTSLDLDTEDFIDDDDDFNIDDDFIEIPIINDEDDNHNDADESNEEMNAFDYVTSDGPSLFPDDEEQYNVDSAMPTTNSAESAFQIEEMAAIGMRVSGHVILNQACALLSRRDKSIKGYRYQKHFVQRIAATSVGKSIPLLYPEAMLFPSIFYKMNENGSLVGALPSSLVSTSKSCNGFASPLSHIRNRLTLSGTSTGTNPRYVSLMYDILANLSLNRQDSRIIVNRGLAVAKNDTGLQLNNAGGSYLHDSIDSKKMVRNLCASQKHHKKTHFITLTCNQKQHFGIRKIKNWIDSEKWIQHIPCFDDLSYEHQNEIRKAIHQSASNRILRNWMEVRKALIEYIHTSICCSFYPVDSIFARDEYQDEEGNLPHIHMIIAVKTWEMDEEQLQNLEELIRASPGTIIRQSEVEKLLEEGIIKSYDDVQDVEMDAEQKLGHTCGPRCWVRVDHTGTEKDFVCRKTNNLLISPDNTRHSYVPIGNKHSPAAIEILRNIDIVQPLQISEHGYIYPFKANHPYLHPQRHVPSTLTTNDCNMSPVETKLFSMCRSMQNVQSLLVCNGCNKYVCKYCAKLDQQNHVIVKSHPNDIGTLMSRSRFLHNTKISTSAYNEKKIMDKDRYKNHPSGRKISLFQMLQQMLGFPEVFHDMNFIQVPTVPLEERAGVEVDPLCSLMKINDSDNLDDYDNLDDGIDLSVPSEKVRRTERNLVGWRQHTESELLTMDGILYSSISPDRITLFSLRPPELRPFIRKVEQYYRWFDICKPLKYDKVIEHLDHTLQKSFLIDGMFHQVKVYSKAFTEIDDYISTLRRNDEIEDDTPLEIVVNYFENMIRLYKASENQNVEELSDIHQQELKFYLKHIINDNKGHLPVVVFSFIKPKNPHRFALHFMLTEGQFDTESDLQCRSLRESFRYCKLIGDSNNPDELQKYSNTLLQQYFTNQLVFYPQSARVIDTLLMNAKQIFDSIIVKDEISYVDMPPFMQSALERKKAAEIEALYQNVKNNMLLSCFAELNNSFLTSNIPSIEAFQDVTSTENSLNWDIINSFHQSTNQTELSFVEQYNALKNTIERIDGYINPQRHGFFNKSGVICGAPGSGKSFLLNYSMLYALSKGLRICVTATMAKRANFLGGMHIHKLFALPHKFISNLHVNAEKAIATLEKRQKTINILRTMDILFIDEIGQVSSQLLSTLDILLRQVRDTNIFFGGILIVATLDHRQLAPVKGLPFLLNSHILTCFDFQTLNHSVRANNDLKFQRLQFICRMHPKEYNQEILDEFKELVSNECTFVDSWDDPIITPDVFRVYGKKLPAREASESYISQVKNLLDPSQYVECESNDLQNQRSSLTEWIPANDYIRNLLDKYTKQPRHLLFFKGAVFEFTRNEDGVYSQSQLCVLINIPSVQDVKNFRRIVVFIAPLGLKAYVYDSNHDDEYFISNNWTVGHISIGPEQEYSLPNNHKGQRHQYPLKHHTSSTVHGFQGDTIHKFATEISQENIHFKLWDKAQVVVLLSRTRSSKDIIFVGSKTSTLKCLVSLIQRKTQWMDHMERILKILNNDQDMGNCFSYEDYPYNFNTLPLPECNTGFVYFLVSLKDKSKIYIGETFDIKTRLHTHNEGYGTQFTEDHRPFCLYAYIIGFNRNKFEMKSMESNWKFACRREIVRGSRCPKQLVESILPYVNDSQGKYKLIVHYTN